MVLAKCPDLLCFIEDVTKWVDSKSPVVVLNHDFWKTFDEVLDQLKSHDTGDKLVNWIEHWLPCRNSSQYGTSESFEIYI